MKKKHSGRHCLLQTSSTISVNQILRLDPFQTVFYDLDVWSLSQTNPKKRCSTILLKSIPPQSCPIQPSSSISVNQVFQSRPLLRLKSMKAGLSALLRKGTNVSFKTIGYSRIMYFCNVFHNMFSCIETWWKGLNISWHVFVYIQSTYLLWLQEWYRCCKNLVAGFRELRIWYIM